MKNNILPKDLFRNGFAIRGDVNNDPIDIHSLEVVRNFIKENFKKRKTINTKVGSRRLKDVIERKVGENKISIGNGDLIASMILEGYEHKKDSETSKNANFNLSQLSVRKFL